MKLRDIENTDKAELLLFEILTISSAVQCNNEETKKKILSGTWFGSSLEDLKAVAMDVEGNSYGWLNGHQLKYFKEEFQNAKRFFEENPISNKLQEAKQIAQKMHTYHPWPKNWGRRNPMTMRHFPSLGAEKDKEYGKLQEQLILAQNEMSKEDKDILAREIRNLSYQK